MAANDHAALDAALRSSATDVSGAGQGQWRCRLPEGQRSVRAELSRHWFRMGLALRTRKGPDAAGRMLARNARIEGCARIYERRGRAELGLDLPRDALPWERPAELASLAARALAMLQAAARRPQTAAAPAAVDTQWSADALPQLFDAAGWPARGDGSGAVEVPLDVPGAYFAAKARTHRGACRLEVAVLAEEFGAAPVACRRAVEALLWPAASRVRMVRPARSRRRLALEVELPPEVDGAPALAGACEALVVVLADVWREAEVLAADERLAEIYLQSLGAAA